MGTAVMILGKSGAGKSTSMQGFSNGDVGVINVLGKPLPFKNNLGVIVTDSYSDIKRTLKDSKANSIVIDDAGYLITNQFMRGHSQFGEGNAIFKFYNELGDNFWSLVEYIKHLPSEKIVYLMMHEDKSEYGDIKPKTIGKLLDDKVCLEGMFTIVLRAIKEDKQHLFVTKSQGFDVSKTPMGMFEKEKIDNDLKYVDDTIREYYELGGKHA